MSSFMKNTLVKLKAQINSNMKLQVISPTQFWIIDRSSVKKYKEISDLNDISDQIHLIDFNRIFHPNLEEYEFCSIENGRKLL